MRGGGVVGGAVGPNREWSSSSFGTNSGACRSIRGVGGEEEDDKRDVRCLSS